MLFVKETFLTKFMIVDGVEFRSYDDNYYVSAHGDVYSVRNDIILRQLTDWQGYHYVTLYKKVRKIHKLVYVVWIGPIPEGLCVLHRDDNKDNNHFSNLYVGTKAENRRDCVDNGHFNNGGSNRISISVRDIETDEIITFNSIRACGSSLGYSPTNEFSLERLIKTKEFSRRYELINYGHPEKSKKDKIDIRKPLVLLDKDTGEELHFASVMDFKRYIGWGSSGSLIQLTQYQWFQDKYEVLKFGRD